MLRHFQRLTVTGRRGAARDHPSPTHADGGSLSGEPQARRVQAPAGLSQAQPESGGWRPVRDSMYNTSSLSFIDFQHNKIVQRLKNQ